jgi:hypothetical protein
MEWKTPMNEKKYFTVEEANRLIPRVKAIVERLRTSRQRLLGHRTAAEAVAGKASGNGGSGEASMYLLEYAETFRRGLAQLEAIGVLLKDVERGLIDFPHWRDGREVYLCWELGEERIDYWHDIDAGYGGRQPL